MNFSFISVILQFDNTEAIDLEDKNASGTTPPHLNLSCVFLIHDLEIWFDIKEKSVIVGSRKISTELSNSSSEVLKMFKMLKCLKTFHFNQSESFGRSHSSKYA